MVKLFIGGFPLDMDEIELAKLIAPHGDIDTLKIVRDKKTRICKGYAFVEMKGREAAEEVIAALDGTEIGDRKLSVKEVTEDTTKSKTVDRPNRSYQKVSRYAEPEKKKRPRRQQ
jgi:RNA recognition motif-containing protein